MGQSRPGSAIGKSVQVRYVPESGTDFTTLTQLPTRRRGQRAHESLAAYQHHFVPHVDDDAKGFGTIRTASIPRSLFSITIKVPARQGS
jgi:hypothetical protein